MHAPQSPGQSPSRGLLGESQEISTEVAQEIRPVPIANSPRSPLRPRWNMFVVKCAIVASLSCFLIGFDIGVLSDSTILVRKDKRVTSEQVEHQAGYLHGCSLIGALVAGWISNKVGRRHTMGWTGAFFFCGTLIMGLFPNSALLMAGRAITQVGVGFAPMIATNYISELSPASCRGLLATFPELFISFGSFIGHGFNYIASELDPNFGARVFLSLGIITSVVFAIGVRVIPESPRWLVIQGRESEAERILAMTSTSKEEATRRLADIIEVNMQSAREDRHWDLRHPTWPVWHMLICASGIQFFQQICGTDTIILYSPSFFEKARVSSYNQKLGWTIAIHFVKALGILFPTFFLEKFGRLRLFLSTLIGMIISLFILGSCLLEIDQNDKAKWAVATSMPSLLFCVGFYSMGLGPVASVYSAEVFPLRLRASGYAVAVATNQFVSGLLAVSFPHLYKAISLGGAVFLFMALAILAWIFIRLVLPETNGQNLEEIWRGFGKLIAWRRSEATREIELRRNSARRQQ